MNMMIFLLTLLSLTFSNKTIAAYHQAPPSFTYQEDKAVFIDFDTATYEISYDLSNQTVEVETTISFYAKEEGHPLFDLIPEPVEVTVDGVSTTTKAIQDPDKQTTLRVIKDKIASGHHELKLKHFISTNVVFNDNGVASAFWMSDLNDRRYLEQYLPSNMEFDQYKMKFLINVLEAEGKNHVVKANGNVSKISENSYEIVFPDFYTTSSVFFHLFPESSNVNNIQFYYPSIDGRLIPVDIYTTFNAQEFVDYAKVILPELEEDYGPFPHNQIIIYGGYPTGGMEYSGATATSLKALAHELFHSYHARALMPANGNAGWMDEAIARWRDNKYPVLEKLTFDSTKIAGHSIWSRMTDRMAYTEGSAFLSWVDFRMNQKGLSLKTFLRDYFQKFKYTTVTTQLFQSELTSASGLDLEQDFDRYIYGKTTGKSSIRKSRMNFSHVHIEENPFHPKLSEKELLDLTSI